MKVCPDVRPQSGYGGFDRASVIGDMPPLTLNRSVLDRRPVNARWMAGIVLMGVAGAVLLGSALRAALGHRAHYASAPIMGMLKPGRQNVADDSRGDRLAGLHPQSRAAAAVRIDQLTDTGSLRKYTQVAARLADLDPDGSGAPNGTTALSVGSSASPGPTSSLPPLILFGTDRRPAAASLRAYAADELLATATRARGTPVNVTTVVRAAASPELRRHVVMARAGDLPSAILDALARGTATDRDNLARSLATQGFARFVGGETITVTEDPTDGHIVRIKVEPPGKSDVRLARSDDGRFLPLVDRSSAVTPAPGADADAALDTRVSVNETLRDSLYALARSNHIDEAVVAEIIRLGEHDFDLDDALGAEDSANILVAPDEFGQSELVYVDLAVRGQHRRYYRYTTPDDNSTSFYDDAGRAVTKFLLRKPVIDGRLGDGFGWRIHPVLRDRRFHEGVDYAAPMGSPIAAAGSGSVEVIGQEWGYGKYIRIMHDRGYETTYAHVAGFPAGLKVGDRVRQGETIAFVGSTGLSTGPHLYYEVRINGHNVDPLRVKLADGRVLQGDTKTSFERERDDIDKLLAASSLTRLHPLRMNQADR